MTPDSCKLAWFASAISVAVLIAFVLFGYSWQTRLDSVEHEQEMMNSNSMTAEHFEKYDYHTVDSFNWWLNNGGLVFNDTGANEGYWECIEWENETKVYHQGDTFKFEGHITHNCSNVSGQGGHGWYETIDANCTATILKPTCIKQLRVNLLE